MKQKILTMILLASLTVSMLAGCGQTETASTVDTQTTETIAQSEEPEQAEEVVTETAGTEVASVEEPEATTEPSTEEVTPEPQPTDEPEPTEETAPEYTYTDMSATMYATQTVNVRNLPSTDGEKVGSLSANQEVTITGQASTGWYRIEYNGGEAYVSDKYLSDTKVEVQASANNSGGGSSGSGQASSGAKNWQDYYADHVWYDMDRFFFIIVDSREEGTQTLDGNNIDYSGAEATLQARFPDEKVYLRFGCPLRDGHWMFFAYVQNSGIDPFVSQFE